MQNEIEQPTDQALFESAIRSELVERRNQLLGLIAFYESLTEDLKKEAIKLTAEIAHSFTDNKYPPINIK